MSNEKQDYIPFGEEWITGMKKHSKDVLIDLLANAYKKNIEQKDNWIKIESKNDLPKDDCKLFVFPEFEGDDVFFFFNDDLSRDLLIENHTHYQPIIKPDFPTI